MQEHAKRKCWICQEEFPLTFEFFYKDKKDKTGFQKRCKECNKITNSRYKNKNPNYFKEKSILAYKKRKTENSNYNVDRYSKYREQYLKRRKEWSSSEYGRLYDMFSAARTRATKKNLEFDLTPDFVFEMYNNQNGLCSLTGLKLDTQLKLNNVNYNPYAPSLDRIDANKGYTKENVRVVSVIANLSLNGFGDVVFDEMCRSYVNKKYGIKLI
jgi:hypothetical protein